MLGQLGNCATPAEKPCYTPCEHTSLVGDLYGQQAGYGGVIALLIKAFLEQQEDFLSRLCDSAPSLKPLAELAGWQRCAPVLTDNGCKQVCGISIRCYEVNTCMPCVIVEANDDFYRSVILASRSPLAITGHGLRARAAAFGWSIWYTPDALYLYIGADDPQQAASVINLFPIPLGELLFIATDC